MPVVYQVLFCLIIGLATLHVRDRVSKFGDNAKVVTWGADHTILGNEGRVLTFVLCSCLISYDGSLRGLPVRTGAVVKLVLHYDLVWPPSWKYRRLVHSAFVSAHKVMHDVFESIFS